MLFHGRPKTRLQGLRRIVPSGILACALIATISACRDLPFKGEEIRERKLVIENAAEGAQTLIFEAPDGSLYTNVEIHQGADLQSANICRNKFIMNLTGGASCREACQERLVSNLPREDRSTAQINQSVEAYSGSSLPTGYKEVPLLNEHVDDLRDTSLTVTVDSVDDYPAISVSDHESFVECGTSAALLSIDAKANDCATSNSDKVHGGLPWNRYGTLGKQGEASWSLIVAIPPTTDTTAPTATTKRFYEVWRDNRTGLLWSSVSVNTSDDSAESFCISSGYRGEVNNGKSDELDCTSNTQNFCGEFLTGGTAAGEGQLLEFGSMTLESYSSGSYSKPKGQMGLKTTPAVAWRLPTMRDFHQAYIDGIQYVMGDIQLFTEKEIPNAYLTQAEVTAGVSFIHYPSATLFTLRNFFLAAGMSADRMFRVIELPNANPAAAASANNGHVRCVGR